MGRVIGTAVCTGPNCSEKVAISETAGGNLACKCQICRWSTYAPPGSKSARTLRAIMTPIDDADDPAPPKAPPAVDPEKKAPPPPPKPPTKSAGFSFEQLIAKK